MSQGKYYDGRTANSHQVDVIIDGSLLRISRGEEVFGRWPLSQVFRDPTNTVSVLLGCGSQDDRLEVHDPELIRSLETHINTKVWADRDLKQTKKFAVPAFILIVALVGTGLWHSRILTKYLAHKVPPEMEQKFRSVVENQSSNERCELSLEQQRALDKITTRIFSMDPENLNAVAISIRKPMIQNAFTLPGGAIWMYRGLLSEMESPEELAGVLAHEIEHVLQRHIVEAVIRATLFTGLLNAFAGDVSGFVLIDPATASQLMGLRLSRDVENEADVKALERLRAAQISTAGMSAFFNRLEKKTKIPNSLTFLTTHPSSDTRAQLFERDAKSDKNRKKEFDLLSKDEWETLKASCT